MISYDRFGPFYDAVMGDRSRSAGSIRTLIKTHCPQCRSVLELACGTGAILQALQDEYQVSGLDLSKAMLRAARQKLKIPLYRADMTAFELGRKFDAIICVFDSINHLTRWTDWKRVFKQTYKHLERRGVFIFDVNTPTKLKALAMSPTWVYQFERNVLLMEVSCNKDALSKWNIKVFEHQSNVHYRLHEEDIYEKAFPLEKIRNTLREIFHKVQVVDLQTGKVSSQSAKLHFICQK